MDVTKGVKMRDKRNGGIRLRSLLLLGAGGLCILYYLLGGILRSFKLSAFWIWLAAGVALMALGFLDRKMAQTGRTWFKGRRSRRAACILAAFVLLYFGVVEAMVFTGVVSRGDPGLHYLIVLGAGVYGEEPSPALRSRTETAIRYLNENPDTKAVLSGRQGPGEDISEAECMARLMRESGISEARIIKEEHSTTTVENIKNSYEIIGSTDLKVGIVTSNFHVFRAVVTARAAGGEDVTGIAAPFSGILLPHYMVRECLAFTVDFVFGRFHTGAGFWKNFS